MNQLHVGFGRVNITPAMGTPIGGYYVVRLAEKVLDELEANAVAFAMGDKKALLISADISGLFYEFAEPLCQQISKATGVPADCIFITCSHTHTGPEVNLNRKILPEKQEAYFPFFCSRHITDNFISMAYQFFDKLLLFSVERQLLPSGLGEICFPRNFINDFLGREWRWWN